MGEVEMMVGVQELIDRLKIQGITEGQNLADQIVKQAQAEAGHIIATAKTEADRLFTEAKRNIDLEKTAAHESIKLAFRDTELTLRSKFREVFSNYLRRLVSYETQDKEFIKQLVLTIAHAKNEKVAQASQVKIQFPIKVVETDETGIHFTEEGKKNLNHLLLGITSQMLREGIELKPTEDFQGGIRVQLIGEDMVIDFSDDALSDMLLKYLLPRYRAIVSGQENG